MTEDLSTLPPETFFRIAVERGGLDLEEVLAGLSPEAADALRHIAAPATPSPPSSSRGATRSASALEAGPPAIPDLQSESERSLRGSPDIPRPQRCSDCGHLSRPGDRFCRRCGHRLGEQQPDRTGSYVTLDDMVAQGRLTPEQAEEATSILVFHQHHYPAGTRYSIYGGKAVTAKSSLSVCR
jgi:hypothetical protein